MPIEPGRPAPDFTLKDQHNQPVSLADFRDRRHVLLVFYPFAFTGTCEGELCGIRDDLDTYQNDRVQVLSVSVDTPYAHKVWAQREGFAFPLLSDFWPHGAVAQSYGVFDQDKGMANRGTFVIDHSGAVRFSEMLLPGQTRDQGAWKRALAELD